MVRNPGHQWRRPSQFAGLFAALLGAGILASACSDLTKNAETEPSKKLASNEGSAPKTHKHAKKTASRIEPPKIEAQPRSGPPKPVLIGRPESSDGEQRQQGQVHEQGAGGGAAPPSEPSTQYETRSGGGSGGGLVMLPGGGTIVPAPSLNQPSPMPSLNPSLTPSSPYANVPVPYPTPYSVPHTAPYEPEGGGGSADLPESSEEPSGGAAPPPDFQPPPPPSMGQGAPAPSAEPPSASSQNAPTAEPRLAPEGGGGEFVPGYTAGQPYAPLPPAYTPQAPSLAPGIPIPSLGEAPPAPIAAPPPPPPPSPAEARDAAKAARDEAEAARNAEAGAKSRAASAPAAADPAKQYDVVPVFYGTDRAVQPDPKRLRFGSERAHVLQLGRALITVPLSHKVPHIELPWLVEIPYFKVKLYEEKEDPNKHFTVQEISSLTEAQMLALVKARLDKSKTFKDHALVFVHGFNTSFDNALFRTAQIAYDLKFDGAPFVYSWPSGGGVASYTYDHGSVEQAEQSLAQFLKLVVEKSGAKSISLIAHSMGNELLLRVLERLRPDVPKGVVISQIILAAPDVDRDKFNMIAREITNFSKGVTLYAASNDRALGYSARFWGGVPRAGDVPVNGGPLIIPGVDTIDVTAVSTDSLGLNHSGYAENPALLDDIKALVEYGVRPPDKRSKNVLSVETTAGLFWRFEAAKSTNALSTTVP